MVVRELLQPHDGAADVIGLSHTLRHLVVNLVEWVDSYNAHATDAGGVVNPVHELVEIEHLIAGAQDEHPRVIQLGKCTSPVGIGPGLLGLSD